MKPQNRKELLLDAIANGKAPDITPESREEAYLKKIAEKAAGGGGGALIIEVTSEDGWTFVPSVTYQEAFDAIMSGKNVYLNYPDERNSMFIRFQSINNQGLLEFVYVWGGNDTEVNISMYCFEKDNNVYKVVASGRLNEMAPPM